MEGGDVKRQKREHLDKLAAIVRRDLRFYAKLVTRMERLGFAGNEPMYRAAITAHHAVHGLSVMIHYATCDGGVGKVRQK